MEPLINVHPQIMSGAPVFMGTRVPIQNLFDYLEGGESLDEFLDDFPTVERDQVIALLETAQQILVQHARAAASAT